jgi:hypothetical protein
MYMAGGDRKHRRSRTLKVVILVVVLCTLVEPLVMYKVLARQREQRRVASQAFMGAPSELVVSTGE